MFVTDSPVPCAPPPVISFETLPEVLRVEVANMVLSVLRAPAQFRSDYPVDNVLCGIIEYRETCITLLEGDEWNNPEAMSEAQFEALILWAQGLDLDGGIDADLHTAAELRFFALAGLTSWEALH